MLDVDYVIESMVMRWKVSFKNASEMRMHRLGYAERTVEC